MKLLSILLGLCFVFSVSQKAFACGCQDGKKADKSGVAATVADAKDMKDSKTEATDKTMACSSDKECTAGKDCSCSKDDKKGAHKHKDGKSCHCSDKKMES